MVDARANPHKIGVAKDSDASIGTRAEAAKDATGDKMNEMKHTVRTHS